MLTILAITFFSAVTSGICEVPQRVPPPSILEGINFIEDNTYHVGLNHNGLHVCSAVLLKTQYDKLVAITAASCLTSEKPKEYTLTYGKIRAGEDDDEYCVLTKIKLYEDFDKKTLNNDLALLLSDDVTKTGSCDLFINNTLGVILANSTTPKSHVKVTGWDSTDNILKVIEDVVCSNSDVCNDQVLKEQNLTIGSTMLCHGIPTSDRDPGKCRGERGSPVVVDVPGSPPVLVAVTSWTLSTSTMKYSLYPCVSTAVYDDSIKKWIESEVDEFASR